MATVPAKKFGMRIDPKRLPMLLACAPSQSRKGQGNRAHRRRHERADEDSDADQCVKSEEEAIEAWCVHVEHYRTTVAVASLLLFAVMITLANRWRNVWDEKKVDCGLE